MYVSDRPGQHDFGLLRRLVLPDGSVLRCRLPGRPTADCLLADVCRDGRTPLKVRGELQAEGWAARGFLVPGQVVQGGPRLLTACAGSATNLISSPPPPGAQVWNVNAVTGVVGVFNIQGSGYSRALRRFHTHDPTPPALTAAVSPADVPALRGAVELFAVYCDGSKASGRSSCLRSSCCSLQTHAHARR